MSDQFTRQYLINSFLVNPQKRLGIYALLNILQDAAWIHATELGHGYESTLAEKNAWVLTRQKVIMDSWPAWGEEITVKTWVRPLHGPFALRDFEILKGDVVIGSSSTSWVLMNLETRTAVTGDMRTLSFTARTDYKLPYDAGKVLITDALEPRATFEVRNSDLDMNEHVNNTRYVQWLLDSIPREWHKRFNLLSYEVNFISETHSGDHVDILMSPERPHETGRFTVQFRGMRSGKPVFAASMIVEAV